MNPGSDQECTAGHRNWDDPRTLLFEPDCSCPRCAPEPAVVDEPGRLRVSGDDRRPRVEPWELGERGRTLLG